jgi:hypothetical protein
MVGFGLGYRFAESGTLRPAVIIIIIITIIIIINHLRGQHVRSHI